MLRCSLRRRLLPRRRRRFSPAGSTSLRKAVRTGCSTRRPRRHSPLPGRRRSATSPATRTRTSTPVSLSVARSATTSSAFASRPKASIGKTRARWRSVGLARASTSTKSRSWGMPTMTSSRDRRSSPISAPAPVWRSSTRALSARRGRARSSPIRPSSAWAGTSTRCSASTWKAVTTARRLPTSATRAPWGTRSTT